jgi:dTDP-4-dehydrorhamnose reductase
MKKRILIIGSKGMAGHVLYQYLNQLGTYHIADISRSPDFWVSTYQFDLSDFAALLQVLNNEKPDIVINCAGILNKAAEDNRDKAILINSYLPHWLARIGNELQYKLIHISTDCVFSGKRGNYTESDLPDGMDIYAWSKALGEVFYGQHLTIRTSIVGPELRENGIGLFQWFSQQTGTIKGYTHAIWTGVTTIELAICIEQAIQENITGLYHLVNNEKISKYALLSLFKEVFNRNDITIEPDPDYVVDKSLISSRSELPVKGYAEMVRQMKSWIESHPK